ncbi:hypothetical protein JOD29_003864 [Lysinibacillus composti]|nr:hypothetical protein [Lysinibacillus composti]MBM7610572.1 hypothetical protein [Lysinibacillus composti]
MKTKTQSDQEQKGLYKADEDQNPIISGAKGLHKADEDQNPVRQGAKVSS